MDLRSLRVRYAVLATLTGVLILAVTFFADHLITDSRKTAAEHIEQRQHLLQRTRYIRNAVWQTREAISHFLLDPRRAANREQLFRGINDGLHNTQRLLDYPWPTDAPMRKDLEQLRRDWQALRDDVNKLVELRTDANKQFPGFAVARQELLPRHREIYSQFAQALLENGRQSATHDAEIYERLVKARYRWSQIITTLRMYIASRVGSFGTNAMPAMERDIRLFYRDFIDQLKSLQALGQQGRLQFNTEAAVDDILATATQWHAGFNQLVAIHSSNAWRQDKNFLQRTIDPALERIWTILLRFDSRIENGSERDVEALSHIAQTQSRTVWLFSLLGMGFVILLFLSFQRAVLDPLGRLARSFNAISRGDQETTLPRARSTELQELLNAFAEMHRQVQQRQQALEYQTLHDDLTGLANRNLLLDRLEQLINTAKRHHQSVCIMMIDLDRFKEVNDSLGHQVGDQLLIQVSARLNRILRAEDTVARLGGDEFALIFNDTDETKANTIANKLVDIFERAFFIAGHELYVRASVGIAIYPKDGIDTQSLIKHADVAMYHAKRYRHGFSFYDARNTEHNTDSFTLGNDLRNAINHNELNLHFQPIFDLATQRPTAVEALLRWHHPEQGALPAPTVISLAEQIGLINQLTFWVLEHAILEYVRLRESGVDIAVHVNLSAHNFESSELVPGVERLMRDYDVAPHVLNIEITESAMMADLARTIDALKRLDAMGVDISIDDYGTGFSSLNYLKQLPVDLLKIDKSFVMHMFENENDAVIVRSTIDLAHNLGMKVVAEGVENQDVWDLLSILRCDFAQGFLMSPPVPSNEVVASLGQWSGQYPGACPGRAN
jgi:diguanylate cyclase (GGDEF)-like protein